MTINLLDILSPYLIGSIITSTIKLHKSWSFGVLHLTLYFMIFFFYHQICIITWDTLNLSQFSTEKSPKWSKFLKNSNNQHNFKIFIHSFCTQLTHFIVIILLTYLSNSLLIINISCLLFFLWEKKWFNSVNYP